MAGAPVILRVTLRRIDPPQFKAHRTRSPIAMRLRLRRFTRVLCILQRWNGLRSAAHAGDSSGNLHHHSDRYLRQPQPLRFVPACSEVTGASQPRLPLSPIRNSVNRLLVPHDLSVRGPRKVFISPSFLARQYGDIVSMPVLRMNRILLNRPDYIQQLLILDHAKLHKSTLTKLVVGPLLGQGLLISEGDFWRRQRRLAQPAFHRSRTNEYSPVMVECALERMRHWRGGETRNIAEEMMKLTLEVAVRTLFGTPLAGDSDAIGSAMTFLMRYYLRRGRSP